MKKNSRKIAAGSLIVALGCGLAFILFGEKFLRINSDVPGRKTDAVVILAGAPFEDKQRISAGASMFSNGRVRYMILPLRHPAFKWSWAVRHYQLEHSIQGTSLLIGRSTPSDKPAIARYGGTYVEAQKTVQIMRNLKLKSAIIVSSGYHMRRSKLAFEHFQKNSNLLFFYYPVDQAANAGTLLWWMDTAYLSKILREYCKLVVAYFVYSSQNSTALPRSQHSSL
jgi:hypothetical protein